MIYRDGKYINDLGQETEIHSGSLVKWGGEMSAESYIIANKVDGLRVLIYSKNIECIEEVAPDKTRIALVDGSVYLLAASFDSLKPAEPKFWDMKLMPEERWENIYGTIGEAGCGGGLF